MAKGKAFVVVGHKDWGKSRTLKALTNGDYHQTTVSIGGVTLFIRRMSNDDKPASFLNFIQALNPETKPHVILTLCPDFEIGATIKILDELHRKYQLYFWVIENQYGVGRQITKAEISHLERYGNVNLFSEACAEDNRRANQLKRFIQNHL